MDEHGILATDTEERLIRLPMSRHSSLMGDLVLPPGALGLVMFAHGSGSSRFSPRNRFVAERLQRAQLGTLLIDLFTQEEEAIDRDTGDLRFDIPFLAERLLAARAWAERDRATQALPVGYFGASTGAAAALVAAAKRPDLVSAIVSRGGRPDLAGASLPDVRAPVLLIIGSLDEVVLRLNRRAAAELGGPSELTIVPGATHLFEEPGALQQVAEHAGGWFRRHLAEGAKVGSAARR